MSKQPPTTPTASPVGPCPTIIQVSRTLQCWKFIQHHCSTRPPSMGWMGILLGGATLLFFIFVSLLKRFKNLILLEPILSLKSRPEFIRALFFREANWKPQKFFPFVKMAENIEMHPYTLRCHNILGDYSYGTRLISVEDVRNYLSHIIYIFIFYFFLNFLLFVRLQTPTSSTDQLWLFVTEWLSPSSFSKQYLMVSWSSF